MRIANWNCCRGRHETKLPPVLGLKPDLAVIARRSEPEALPPPAGVGWLFWNEHVPGLPPADSEEGQRILAPVRAKAQRERDKREQARRRALERELR